MEKLNECEKCEGVGTLFLSNGPDDVDAIECDACGWKEAAPTAATSFLTALQELKAAVTDLKEVAADLQKSAENILAGTSKLV